MEITSLDNQYVKHVTSLHKKKYRDEYGEFFIEGIKTIKEAVKYNQKVRSIFYCPKMVDYDLDIPAIEVSKEVIAKMADTQTPQGIIAICEIPQNDIIKKDKLIFLDRVQDPGNVGTIIRTADAFGFDGVLLSEGCADIYSPKVVRATMGSMFHIDIKQNVLVSEVAGFGNKVYSSSLDTNKYLDDINIEAPFVLVIGNEGQGISDDVKAVTDEFVKINMPGNAESLNASIASGILMYEFNRKCVNKKEL